MTTDPDTPVTLALTASDAVFLCGIVAAGIEEIKSARLTGAEWESVKDFVGNLESVRQKILGALPEDVREQL